MDTDLGASFLQPNEGAATYEELAGLLEGHVRKALKHEHAPSAREIAAVLGKLLAYSVAIERILASAERSRLGTPGLSVRALTEQALSGEGRQAASLRLHGYFKEAITAFMRVYSGQAEAIKQFAEDLASAMHPARIEELVHPSGFLKMFGLHEGAYWREFVKQYRNLDADGLREMAEKQRGNQ